MTDGGHPRTADTGAKDMAASGENNRGITVYASASFEYFIK